MKYNLKKASLLFIVALVLTTCGQNKQQSVALKYEEFLNHVKEGNSEMINFIHPSYFSVYSKDTLILQTDALRSYNQTDEGKKMPVKFDLMKIESISDTVVIGSSMYCFLKSFLQMQLDFTEVAKSGDGNFVIGLAIGEFERQFGKGNVKYDKNNYTMTLIERRKDYGIRETPQADWKFLRLEDKTRQLVDSIIPLEIRTAIEVN